MRPHWVPSSWEVRRPVSRTPTPRGRNLDLFLVNVDRSGLEQVTAHSDFDGFPMFSRDGRKLVWASNRSGMAQGETNIFIVDWVP